MYFIYSSTNGQAASDLDPSFAARLQSARLKWNSWTEHEFKDLSFLENVVPKDLMPTPVPNAENDGIMGKMKNLICGSDAGRKRKEIIRENELKKVRPLKSFLSNASFREKIYQLNKIIYLPCYSVCLKAWV